MFIPQSTNVGSCVLCFPLQMSPDSHDEWSNSEGVQYFFGQHMQVGVFGVCYHQSGLQGMM